MSLAGIPARIDDAVVNGMEHIVLASFVEGSRRAVAPL